MTPDTYLTPREAAEYLRTSTSTLAKRRLYNDEPKFCQLGRAIRYRRSDLDEFMARTRVQSASEILDDGRRSSVSFELPFNAALVVMDGLALSSCESPCASPTAISSPLQLSGVTLGLSPNSAGYSRVRSR